MPKKRLQGIVISNKMQKTVVVAVERLKKHPLYQKRVRRHRKYKVHTEMSLKVGDLLIIEESRPFSKEKNWIVKEVLKQKVDNAQGEKR